MMNLIDISSWQRGIDLQSLFRLNPTLDGVIVKATQGTGYVNPCYAEWVKWLADNDKPFGVYHYCTTENPEAEAEHFYKTVKPYIGKCVLCADYEDPATSKGTAWLKRFLDRFYALSGVRCMIYCSLSVVQTQQFDFLTVYPLWMAQYADMNTVNGFLDTPWQKGSVAPFNSYAMHQYTSCGRLNGYSGNLDFNKFYGSYAAWNALCKGEDKPAPEPSPAPAPATLKPANPVVVGEILAGGYGTGTERAARLKAAGYDPDDVQRKVNELYGIALSCKKYINGNEAYINSITKILKVL